MLQLGLSTRVQHRSGSPGPAEDFRMEAFPHQLTRKDLATLDQKTRWELIDGVAYAMSGASKLHQLLLLQFASRLEAHFRGSACEVVMAPYDVKLSEHDVVQPDLLVSCSGRAGSHEHEGPPDLVIEIVSPSSHRHDRVRKMNLYSRAGVPEFWLISPHPFSLEVYARLNNHLAVHGCYEKGSHRVSARFPELLLDLDALLATLPPQPAVPGEVCETAPIYAATGSTSPT